MRKNAVLIVAIIAIAAVLGLRVAVNEMSGVSPPFTVVDSQSMQHSHDSEVGIIDTGDMILLRDTSKHEPVTYVEGYSSGYRMFGEYGDVIVYERPGQNQVIHRAILYLESNGDGTFTGRGLESYTGKWSCHDSGTDTSNPSEPSKLSGTLEMENIGYGGKKVSIDLSVLSGSGYLTMGDNADTNGYFDQGSGITSGLVTDDRVKATAWKEIPWAGSVKLIMNGNDGALNSWAPSSLGYLTAALATIFMTIIGIGFALDALHLRKALKGGH
ncbi:S26 family signal peptidase [Methanomassiliicoccales archaeon LGM-DZ1]|nr:S26 family signal peptidase [Methanomassiliicoccales archaeon LGM-DZ1]